MRILYGVYRQIISTSIIRTSMTRIRPFEETLEAHQKLIQEGKVRHIASSNYEPARLKEVLALAKEKGLPRYVAHQPEYNLFDRAGYENELEKICTDEGLGVVTFFSLASGFLSGKYRTADDLKKSKREIFLTKYMNDRGLKILAALDAVSKDKGVPAAVISIAWILHRPSVTAPIVSATTLAQLDQLISAVDLKLTDKDMEILNQASGY